MTQEDLIKREYRTISAVSGPLLFVRGLKKACFGEMCKIKLSTGEVRTGEILKLEGDLAVVEALEGTSGIDSEKCSVIPLGEVAKAGLSVDMLGRTFNGVGMAIDGLPDILPEMYSGIGGAVINPCMRERPEHFIETGISAIDGLNTLVRGQKLPIFSGAGIAAGELAVQIIKQAKISGAEEFACVFGCMGITSREAFFFRENLLRSRGANHTVSFMNLAGDPSIERLFTPRMALTVAEYLAFEKNYHVLVILTDMTSYCEALREVASAREEIPGRRSYPGYMYTDLASIYERAGRIKGKSGSITIISIVTMPEDDITHPIPDLTGYITEGQIVLSRALHNKGIYPPIDVLPSLSRLMNLGIGQGKTMAGHRTIADKLYSAYAKGVDARRMAAIAGVEGLSEADKTHTLFADEFEKKFIGQGMAERGIGQTLELAKALLKIVGGG